jgi:oligosaccharide reducing-end xylanase
LNEIHGNFKLINAFNYNEMKKIVEFLLISDILLQSLPLFSQNVTAPYEVATWSGFRTAAICYTFDDGCPNQLKMAVPLFDKYGFKLTLFTITSWANNWAALKLAAENGHEVASHTVTHPNFGKISQQQQTFELQHSKDTIESCISPIKCLTIAYPYCVPGNDSICSKYYISARGCQGFIEPKTPGSYYNVSSIGGGNLGTINTLSDFKLKFASAAKTNGWCVFLFHGIDDDGGYSPITSAELAKSIEYLSVRKSKFWVTTFLNATLYSKERDAVKVKETAANNISMTLEITDALQNSIYNFPLTIRRPLPKGWPSATVTQKGVSVPMRIVNVDSVVYITFDVIPNAGEVKLSKCLTPVTPEIDIVPADSINPVETKKADKLSSILNLKFSGEKLLFS